MIRRLRSRRGPSPPSILLALGLALGAAFAGGIYFACNTAKNPSGRPRPHPADRFPLLRQERPIPSGGSPLENPPSGNASLRFRFSWNGPPAARRPGRKITIMRADERGGYRYKIRPAGDRRPGTADAAGLPGRYLLYADAFTGRRREPGSFWSGTGLSTPILIPGPSEMETR